jgi:hypothetical protein
VVALSIDAAKDFGGKDIRIPEPPLLREPSADTEGSTPHEIGVLDIALASWHRGTTMLFVGC